MIKTYKYRIYPNKIQREVIQSNFGACRYVFNRALDFKTRRYQQHGQIVFRFELSKLLTFWKSTEELKFLRNANAQSLQSELLHLEKAFQNFFDGRANYPRFKRKKDKVSFDLPQHVRVNFAARKIHCPKLGEFRFRDARRFDGSIKTCAIKQDRSGRYFAFVQVEEVDREGVPPPLREKCVGIDVGLKTFATLSSGEKVGNPHVFNMEIEKIRHLHRNFSRKVVRSKNWKKYRLHLAKAYAITSDRRRDFLHKLTTRLVKNHDGLFVEDLNIKGMRGMRNLARAVDDVSWGEFFRQLAYKSGWAHKAFLKIGRFDPSSRLCTCGIINKALNFEDREWTCKSCGITHDRDLLAARNILNFGWVKYAGRGTPSEPVEEPTKVGPMKQEGFKGPSGLPGRSQKPYHVHTTVGF